MTTIQGLERYVLVSLRLFFLCEFLNGTVATIVDPSVIFYLESVGGTPEDFGLATSVSSLGSTLMTAIIGLWIDKNGNKYRAPYIFVLSIGIAGSLIYFLASMLPSGFWAVNAILIGKFLMGAGGALVVIVASWVAVEIPLEKQKAVFTISMAIQGTSQAVGPKLNTLIAEIDTSIAITSNYSISLDPLNSVALVSAFNGVLLCLIIGLLFRDPSPRKEHLLIDSTNVAAEQPQPHPHILRALMHFNIAFPIIELIFTAFNSGFYGLAKPQVSKYMLDWTPLEISKLAVAELGAGTIGFYIMLFMSLVSTPDYFVLLVGNVVVMMAGASAYLLWRVDTAAVSTFVAPILLNTIGVPFFSPAIKSSFNRAVLSRPELARSIATLQTLLITTQAIVGIVCPLFVETYVLRNPDEISLNSPHELTRWAWFIPISSLLVIVGLLYEEFVLGNNESDAAENNDDEVIPDETSKLVTNKRSKSTRHSIVEINQVFSRQYEVSRRMSSASDLYINGIGIVNPLETASGSELMKKLSSDKEEWLHLLGLDEEYDEDVEMDE